MVCRRIVRIQLNRALKARLSLCPLTLRGTYYIAKCCVGLREGRVEGAWAQFRRQPLQVLAAVIGIVLMVALTLLPFLLLRG